MDQQIDHACDLLPRSKWQKADRMAWRQLVRPQIVGAVRLMSPLYDVMHDIQSNPTALTREIQTLGDAILTGETRTEGAALAEASYAQLELTHTYLSFKKPGNPVKMQVVYTQLSDFLDLLKDERGSMRLYLGQCVAFDEDEDQVPDTLKPFELDEAQYSLLRSFAWESLDLLNGIILPLRAEEVGTTFKVHNAAQLYHHGEMMDLVGGTVGKLFHGLGYPMAVNKDEGLTFEDFLKKMKRIAWLVASEKVLQKMEESPKQLSGVKTMRKRLPGLFTDQQEARSLPGLELMEHDTGRCKGRGAGKGKPPGGTSGAGPSNATGGRQEGAQDGSTDTRTKFEEMSKEMRVKLNPKRVFYYNDSSHSMKSHLFHWKKKCLWL
ncbi:MAG: hypothetical protein SGPRY_013787 [Prymnesium sp.]